MFTKYDSYTIRSTSNVCQFMLLASLRCELGCNVYRITYPEYSIPYLCAFPNKSKPRANYLDTYKYHRHRIYVALLVDDATCPTTLADWV